MVMGKWSLGYLWSYKPLPFPSQILLPLVTQVKLFSKVNALWPKRQNWFAWPNEAEVFWVPYHFWRGKKCYYLKDADELCRYTCKYSHYPANWVVGLEREMV